MTRYNRGIALPVIFGLVLCIAIWVGSLSWTMARSRSRFQHTMKSRRAYFMARSALQHFFLKLKVLQDKFPQSFRALTEADVKQWPLLSKAFVEDIIPQESNESSSAQYRITAFTLEKLHNESEALAVKIVAEGEVDGAKDSITRTQKITP